MEKKIEREKGRVASRKRSKSGVKDSFKKNEHSHVRPRSKSADVRNSRMRGAKVRNSMHKSQRNVKKEKSIPTKYDKVARGSEKWPEINTRLTSKRELPALKPQLLKLW